MPSCLRTAPGSGGVPRVAVSAGPAWGASTPHCASILEHARPGPQLPLGSAARMPSIPSRACAKLDCQSSLQSLSSRKTVAPPSTRCCQRPWGVLASRAQGRAARLLGPCHHAPAAAPPTPPVLPSCSACWCPRLSLRAAWRFWAQHPGCSRWHLAHIGHLGLVLTVLSWSPSPQHRSLFGPLSSLGFLLWTQSSFHSPLLHPASVHPRACALTPPRARLGRARVPSALAEPSGRAPGQPLFCGGTAPSSLCEQLSLTGQPAPPHPAQPHLRRCPSWVASALLRGSTQGRARAQGWCGWSPCAAVSWTSCGFQSGRLTGSGFDVPRLQTQQRKDNV